MTARNPDAGSPRSERSTQKGGVDWKRVFFIFLGIGLFLLVYYSPPWPGALEPQEGAPPVEIPLSHEAKAALGLFLLAATWWVTEVVPIGVTSIMIAVVQVLVMIRIDPSIPREQAEAIARTKPFTDFLDPSVWFIFGSLTIGMVFTKTGLTRRIAYKMLVLVGEKTSMILLGVFVMTAALTLVMAHTAVAATVYPLLLAIYALYQEDGKTSKFGKSLFMGMAYVAGAGSIITLLGAARGAVAIGFFQGVYPEKTVGFFELTWYMLPVGLVMTLLLWAYFMVYYRPERKTIPGLRERAKRLYSSLGPISRGEITALGIVLAVILVLSLRAVFPVNLAFLHKSAVILVGTVLFFLMRILSLEDLEDLPWNIILLFGGAMSIGFCLWETGAAKWLALQWLGMFEGGNPYIFILGIAFFVLVMTNFIMNVAAIAIVLPVALTMAPFLDVAGEVILYSALVTAGMPFLLLVGAAPNAIAYQSKMFTTRQFFTAGVPASLVLMGVLAVFVLFIWPVMGMPVLLR